MSPRLGGGVRSSPGFATTTRGARTRRSRTGPPCHDSRRRWREQRAEQQQLAGRARPFADAVGRARLATRPMLSLSELTRRAAAVGPPLLTLAPDTLAAAGA